MLQFIHSFCNEDIDCTFVPSLLRGKDHNRVVSLFLSLSSMNSYRLWMGSSLQVLQCTMPMCRALEFIYYRLQASRAGHKCFAYV